MKRGSTYINARTQSLLALRFATLFSIDFSSYETIELLL